MRHLGVPDKADEVPMLAKTNASCDWRKKGGDILISSNVKVAAAGASLDVPIGHKNDSWSFSHFDTITVSVADAPRSDEILVVMPIVDGRLLRNRCGTEPIRE
jgi:amino acid synthesis protein